MSLRFAVFAFAAATLFSVSAQSVAQSAAHGGAHGTGGREAATTAGEARAAERMEAARKQGEPELYAFLKLFPKGADLHMHLSGAVYAETFLREAAAQGMCVDPAALTFVKAAAKGCAAPLVAAATVVGDPGTPSEMLYEKLVNAFSMRSFVPYAGWSGHDQFFATFDHFGGLKDVQGEWLDEVATRAAAQNEQYLEIMQTPPFTAAAGAAAKIPWPADGITDANYRQELPRLREAFLAAGLRDDVSVDAKAFADAQTARRNLEACDAPVAGVQIPACSVRVHFLFQVLRGLPPALVFAQTLLAFEVASTNPDVVGLNFVRAEDWRGPMANYHTEQLMLDYLHTVYPGVHISLHAGELAPGLVPPDGLTFHIREAVELGHAERIGHGIDVLHEFASAQHPDPSRKADESAETPEALLRLMARRHVMVETNLTSNDVILGVKGSDHPLAAYRAAHVPWALSTDDEGVSRIDLTHEYVRGVVEQGLTYLDLKQSARTSLEHSFLHGESLYAAADDFGHRKAACAAVITAAARPAAGCQALLDASEKAAAQWDLERRFAVFEAGR